MGDAFCTDVDYHLLNVPAGKMSAYDDNPGDLVEWLSLAGYDYNPYSFIPRRLYKNYIFYTLEKEMACGAGYVQVEFIRGEATDVSEERRGVVVDGRDTIQADMVILALGNFPPGNLRLEDNAYLNLPGYYRSAWESDFFRELDTDDPVLLLGTGLTMVDMVLTLHQRGHRGGIFVLSTHGYVPTSHMPPGVYHSFERELYEAEDVVGLFKVIRANIRKAKAMNIDWRAVIDSIRPFTQKVWLKLSIRERWRFLEHLRHIWGVARHRMPADNAALVEQLIQTGQVQVLAGRVSSIGATGQTGFQIMYKERGSRLERVIYSKVIVNCMGPELNWNRIKQPLVTNLLNKGVIDTDELRLGVNCMPDGAIIGKNGRVSEFLYTIGPTTKGILWESTAVPEIRHQALQLTNLVFRVVIHSLL
ncbi:hypothetical protein GCM10011511_16130 [Puia dinghuensis]|uniref:FAD-dependent urate hydroxylase HpyO/Asp monooxygenase CreE-like FAD/NAD(P)-binding domain-containing protein n=2 Tax=Puia dinghuensis TaxID=1792502 RepID=A0A8J2UBU2_9BACT|nr:hypothetical protein GCM10011511_16130 [Puia dinghuensis]